MSILDETIYCFQNALNFKERADRTEFWEFVLFFILTSIVLVVVNSIIFGPTVQTGYQIKINSDGQQTQIPFTKTSYTSGWLGNIFGLVAILPGFAVSVRRLHDTGRSAWYLLTPWIGFAIALSIMFFFTKDMPIDPALSPLGKDSIRVPSSGTAVATAWLIAISSNAIYIFWLARRSSPETNKYGPNPNEVLS